MACSQSSPAPADARPGRTISWGFLAVLAGLWLIPFLGARSLVPVFEDMIAQQRVVFPVIARLCVLCNRMLCATYPGLLAQLVLFGLVLGGYLILSTPKVRRTYLYSLVLIDILWILGNLFALYMGLVNAYPPLLF